MNATQKQLSYIIDLYNQVHDTDHGFISQCQDLQLTNREKQGRMTKQEASAYIRRLRKQAGLD